MNISNDASTLRRSDKPTPRYELGVSAYDRASGGLLSLLTIIGAGVFLLLVVWFTGRVLSWQTSVPVVIQDVGGGSESGMIGESMQLDSPEPQDIPRESELEEPPLEETLAAVTDAAALRQAQLDDPFISDSSDASGGGRSTGTGDRLGLGAGEGPSGVPRALRWEIRQEPGLTIEAYAAQLDFFNIELAVVGSNQVAAYYSRFSQPTPLERGQVGADDTRLYFSWRDGQGQSAAAADRELLKRAGVNLQGKNIFVVIPPDLENQLAQIEQDFAGRDASEIRKTRFGVRSAGGQFTFYVMDQTYL